MVEGVSVEDPLVPSINFASAPPGTRLTDEQVGRLRNAALFTTIAGATYALLFIISYWLMLDVPNQDASADELGDYYASTDGRIINLVALYLLPFGGIAFLWFVVSLRMWISVRAVRPINALFSTVQFASGLLFLALLFASAAAISIGPVTYTGPDDLPHTVVTREFPLFGTSLFFIFATRMGAMFVFTTTRICASAAIIPKWFTYVGLVVGVVMLLTSSFNRWMIVVFPIWVLVLCLLTQLHVRGLLQQRRAAITAARAHTD
jgi:hypothetical protein